MAFISSNFQKISSSLNDAEPRMWSYSSEADSLEDIKVISYFQDVAEQVTVGDVVYVRVSNGEQFFKFSLIGPALFLSDPIHSLICLNTEFTTAGAAQEDFGIPIPITGRIIRVALATPDGTGVGETYDMELHYDVSTLTTITIPASQSAFVMEIKSLSPPVSVNKTLFLWWRKLVGVAATVRLQSEVIIEASDLY